MRDRHSTDVATAARIAHEDLGRDLPSRAEYDMDPAAPIVFQRCPATEALTGYAWECADPACRGGICVRAEASRPAKAWVAG